MYQQWRHFDFHARLTKENFSSETTKASQSCNQKKKNITRGVSSKLTIQILSSPNRVTHWGSNECRLFSLLDKRKLSLLKQETKASQSCNQKKKNINSPECFQQVNHTNTISSPNRVTHWGSNECRLFSRSMFVDRRRS